LTETENTTESEGYYGVGETTFGDIVKLYPDAPEKFKELPYPETVPMVDSLKKSIKNLSGLSPRNFAGSAFYITTTDATLITPIYGGGMLSDARRYRTELVNIECNTEITTLEKPKDTLAQDIRIAMQAGEVVADILCVPFDVQSELIRHGLLVNLKKVPFLHLNADYYNASATEAFSVNGNIFGLVSDLTFDPSNIYSVFYNKTLVKEYNITNPVQTYKDGKWDFDGMFNAAKELTAAIADVNREAGPAYSIGIDKENNDIINGLFVSSGGKYFTKRNYNYPVLNFSNEKTLKLLDNITTIFAPQSETGMMNFLNSGEDIQSDAFIKGNILFSISKLDIIPKITDSSFDWGIIPVPSTDGSYENRFSFTDNNDYCISILKGARNTEASGIITNALSSASHRQLKEVYVRDRMTYHLRDVDSVIILSDIINNVTYNQYNVYPTMYEISGATAGVIKEAANRRGYFEDMYENNQAVLNDFFTNSRFFDRD